ncbi:MAG: hypothetical protein MJZ20_07000 [Bacteroidaceae bacterium]|nr:hypothetical protein [Bacteroidaceae bacterium]
MKDKINRILNMLGIDSVLEDEIESPQLITYYYNLKDSRMISKVNQTNLEIISDYLKKTVELHKGGKYSFSLCIPKDLPDLVDFNTIEQTENSSRSIKVNVGVDTNNKNIVIDFNKVNHLLVAGCTGSGKSVFINTLLCGLIKSTPMQDYDLKLIDPKRVSFNMYKKLPNVELITEMDQASSTLSAMIDLMEQRYQYMESTELTDKNIFKPVFIVVDELAELMLVDRGGCEKQLIRLLQKARQANIHIILATQRPTTDVISGLIKAQCDTRVCLKMASYKDSMTVIDKGIGQRLLGHGDGYIKYPFETEERRFQTAFLEDEAASELVRNIVTKAVLTVRTAAAIKYASTQKETEIKNSRVKKFIKECVDNMKKWGYNIPENIKWNEGTSSEWLGKTNYSTKTITLNDRICNQSDIMIKITIYHELAHVLAGQNAGHKGSWITITNDIHEKTQYRFAETAPVTIF